MKEKNAPSLKRQEIIFLSFFWTGFFPKAPGTAGTLATLPFLYALSQFNTPKFLFIPFLIIVTVISCFIADITQKRLKLHDPGWIVIDEVLGMATAWLFINNDSLLHLITLFVLFRFFDIIKFWPASYLDKKVEHGMGTILDDIVSGVFAGVSYKLIFLAVNSFTY